MKRCKKKSIDELIAIARLRRIRNIEKLTNKYLVLTLLKSEISALERNYMKHFNNNNNNTNNIDDT